jgi:hypothetical protein
VLERWGCDLNLIVPYLVCKGDMVVPYLDFCKSSEPAHSLYLATLTQDQV